MNKGLNINQIIHRVALGEVCPQEAIYDIKELGFTFSSVRRIFPNIRGNNKFSRLLNGLMFIYRRNRI